MKGEHELRSLFVSRLFLLSTTLLQEFVWQYNVGENEAVRSLEITKVLG